MWAARAITLFGVILSLAVNAWPEGPEKRPPTAPFPTPEAAVNSWLAAMQARDNEAILATYPEAVRDALKELVPLGEEARQAMHRLEDALFEKFGGRKRGTIDPADLFPLLRPPVQNFDNVAKIVKYKVTGKETEDKVQVKVRVSLTVARDDKEESAEMSFVVAREGKGWSFTDPHWVEAERLQLRDPDRRKELVAFAKRARAGFESVEKEVKAGKYQSFDEAAEALGKRIRPLPVAKPGARE